MPPQTRSNTCKPMTKVKRSSDITTVDLDPPEPWLIYRNQREHEN